MDSYIFIGILSFLLILQRFLTLLAIIILFCGQYQYQLQNAQYPASYSYITKHNLWLGVQICIPSLSLVQKRSVRDASKLLYMCDVENALSSWFPCWRSCSRVLLLVLADDLVVLSCENLMIIWCMHGSWDSLLTNQHSCFQ